MSSLSMRRPRRRWRWGRFDLRLLRRGRHGARRHVGRHLDRPLLPAPPAPLLRLLAEAVVLVGGLDRLVDLGDEPALAPVVHVLAERPLVEGAVGLDELATLAHLLVEYALHVRLVLDDVGREEDEQVRLHLLLLLVLEQVAE